MACQPKFDAAIQWECVSAIIAQIRNPGGNWQEILSQALWAAGCAQALLGPSHGPLMTASAVLTVEELSEQVSARMPLMESEHRVAATSIDTATIIMIVQLILKFLASRR